MSAFRAAEPHGPITEVFPDLFFVTGRFRIAPGVSITRNMVVVRQGDELTAVNAIRLTTEGEEELAKLGRVRHLVRIGFAHGADDPFYVDRYRATFWAPKGQRHAAGVAPAQELMPGNSPLSGTQVFPFKSGKGPEAALLLERNGGVLVTCDSFQNWTTFEGCSALGKLVGKLAGLGPAVIGGPWARYMGRDVKRDFDQLVELPFQHSLSAHGTPLKGTAREGLKAAIARRFRG